MSTRHTVPAKPTPPLVTRTQYDALLGHRLAQPTLPPPALNANGRVLYFAFGSNMDLAQMRARCPGSRALWPAVLDGYTIGFVGYSHAWRGGVATIIEAPGDSVDGFAYELTVADVEALDGYEGAPYVYKRIEFDMLDDDGAALKCITYVHTSPGAACKPGPKYAAKILDAYEREGLSTAPVLAAIARAPAPVWAKPRKPQSNAKPVKPQRPPMRVEDMPAFSVDAPFTKPHLLFVYGSLLKGMRAHHLMQSIGAEFYGETDLPPRYHLLDAAQGAWPGLLAGGRTKVEGELYFVDAAGLTVLDQYEGAPELFRRERVQIGSGARAWVYVLNTSPDLVGCPIVRNGSWRDYSGRK